MTPTALVTGGLNWQRLGSAVLARRRELRLRQEEISTAGGPSHATLRHIEHGEPGQYQERTLLRLEQVLRWQPGSIHKLLNGGEPTPVMPEGAQPGPEAGLSDQTVYGLAISRLAISDHPAAQPALLALALILFDP